MPRGESAGPLDPFADRHTDDASNFLARHDHALPLELGAEPAIQLGALLLEGRWTPQVAGGRRRLILRRLAASFAAQ